jgi:hypothetical protein
MDETTIILVGVIALLVVILIVGLVVPKVRAQRHRKNLQNRFGPEYERTVRKEGDRDAAEAELERRQEHRAALDIRPLEPGERDRYAAEWRDTQKRFVDEPAAAIRDADRLVTQVMRDRGYPTDDFDQRADDISVDHPGVVEDYRAANAIARSNERGEAGTEDLRQGLVHYRSLFDRLLGTDDASDDGTPRNDRTPTNQQEVR